MEEKNKSFTVIHHDFRIDHDISWIEYGACDFINAYSSFEKSTVPGWCYMKRKNIADFLGISEAGLRKIIIRLIDKGLIVRQESTNFLKTTDAWKEVEFYTAKNKRGRNKVADSPQQSSDDSPQQSSGHISKKSPLSNNNSSKESQKEIFDDILLWYHNIPELPKVLKLTQKRKSNIRARLKEHGPENTRAVFNKVINSDFLKGKNDRGWKADIDFIFSASGFVKILEGKYDNKKGNGKIIKDGVEWADEAVANSGVATGGRHITREYLQSIYDELEGK